ncbi:DsbA family protein [Mucilaginibacter sp.]
MPVELTPPVSEKDHVLGPAKAAIEIVEFGDYQCPDCGVAYPVIKQIQKIYGDQIRFVFRNLPLTDIHTYAKAAAMAAEAAGQQNKFWEMHDLIYEHQTQLDNELLYSLARKLGLNAEQFEQDLHNRALLQRLKDDTQSAEDSQVPGTPTFFVNGKMFDGSAEDLLQVLGESAE